MYASRGGLLGAAQGPAQPLCTTNRGRTFRSGTCCGGRFAAGMQTDTWHLDHVSVRQRFNVLEEGTHGKFKTAWFHFPVIVFGERPAISETQITHR